ncbi:MAG: tetratricopeptide repeat protein [Planctomycetota bacterium]
MEKLQTHPEMLLFSRAYWFERQDRYDEALDAITQAVDIRDARSSIAYRAHLLTLVGRDEDAYEMLKQYDAQKQAASFSWQMSAMAYERRDYAECSRLLERFESLSPLLERAFGERFTMFRCELSRRAGDDEKAIEYAKRSRSAFGKKVAQRLADTERRDRVDKILPVEFVRQHEMTCGPATLSAISHFWGRSAEHLEVAEEICYNGTTAHAERNWAKQHGYFTREFTVTEEATESMIGRDIPFTLVTRGAGYAHLQAVIGYDGRTGTILIRDPFHRVRGAAAADELLESQAAHGPRGMVLVPEADAEKLAGIELPDAELYDLIHEMDDALIQHDRDRAVGALKQIEDQAPDHQLHWQAKRQLATYDGNEQGILAAVQEIRKLYPDDVSFQMSELSLLGNLGKSAERIARLRELVARPMPHPLLKLQLAESLALDGRHRDEAQQLLREAIRKGPSYARSYLELGDLWWQRNERAAALRLFRFAANLEEKDEYLAQRFFDACVAMGRTEEALQWLQARYDRFGGQSMQPSVTLQHALSRLGRHAEGIAVLEEAMKRRPDDKELVLSAVHSLAATSSEYWPRAKELLQSVKGKAPERGWHETASELAVLQGKWQEGLDHLEHLLPRSPLSMPLREKISDLIGQIDGEEAAIEHWRRASEEFQHYQPLAERYAMALRTRPLEEIEPVLRNILAQSPDNAWAVRELASHVMAAGKLDEAEKLTEQACQLDGENAFAVGLLASLDARRGDNASARKRLREILQNDICNEYLLSRFLDSCDSVEELTDELDWVIQQLQKQPITEDVLLVYRDYAESVVPAEDLLQSLQEAVEARSDLWQAHQAHIRQLTHMQQLDEAMAASERAAERFALEPNAWFEMYRVASAVGDAATQKRALKRCDLLRPNNPTVVRALSDVLCSEGYYQEARELLEQLISVRPLDPVNRGYLADVLAELGETEPALEQYENAVSLEPDYEYGWGRLEGMAEELGRKGYRLQLAERLTKEQPHSAGLWLEYGRTLGMNEEFEQAHEALTKAEAIDPYREAIHIARARLLLNAGDFESAMAALQPEIYPTTPASLEATRAQMLWDIGQQQDAYDLIQQTATQNPGHLGIWHRLEQWAMTRGDRDQAITAVEHQIESQPHDPDVLDSAASSLVDLGDIEKAIATYRRIVEIAPGYAGSRCCLFDLLVEQDEWDEAAALMRDLPRCDQHPTVIARRMQVTVRDKDLSQAEQDFDAIIHNDQWSWWAVEHAIEMMSELGNRDWVLAQIETELRNPDSHEDFGRAWAMIQLTNPRAFGDKLTTVSKRIRQWISGEHPAAGRSAMSTLMPHFAQQGPGMLGFLKRFINENEDWIRSDTHAWTSIAYAMADQPGMIPKQLIKQWIDGWQQRDDFAPWMLTNVHELCRIIGDEAGGRDAVQTALQMPADQMQSQLRLWAAHDSLVEGDNQEALHHFMGAARLEYLEGLDQLLHYWVEAVINARQSTDKQAAFAQIKSQFKALGLKPKFFTEQPAYLQPYIRTLRMIAEAIGTPSAKWWCLKKTLRVKMAGMGLS